LQVLFQNESSATLLARIIGIVGPIKAEMLDMGHNTHKYFTKNYVLYEQNKVFFFFPQRLLFVSNP
jgi:hypothetical protein